jgi:glycogen synthase
MGRLIREKGLEDILKASSSITESNSKIIVVGKGEEKYEKALD